MTMLNNMEVLRMKKLYMDPEVEMIEFDTKDVITTSGEGELGGVAGSSDEANILDGWSGLY